MLKSPTATRLLSTVWGLAVHLLLVTAMGGAKFLGSGCVLLHTALVWRIPRFVSESQGDRDFCDMLLSSPSIKEKVADLDDSLNWLVGV